ncbi:MAG: PadR family transcriptional regulator [Acidimicrobiales bacterium]
MNVQRLNEQRFLILTALATGPLHGYGLVAEIADITKGESRPRPGSLYHGLDKMLEQGLVEVASEAVVDGRLRRSYALTSSGRELLAATALRRRREADTAIGRLGLAYRIT